MIFNVRLFFLLTIFSCTIINAVPLRRSRRQIDHNNLPYGGWGGGSNNPSGGIPGAYYGTGNNPGYGNVGPSVNQAEHGIVPVNYNGYNPSWNQQQQQYQQQYQQNNPSNNNNNAWQGSNSNNNYNNPSNRYPPGSQGWYATGGNYWYNKGASLKSHPWFIITIIFAISVICI